MRSRALSSNHFVAIAAILSLSLFAGRAAAGQDTGATVDGTRTPDAPAFVLLGLSPTQVERPTTPRALALNVLSSTIGNDTLIPQNYALQVAPYWLVGHPALSSDAYYNPTLKQGLLDTLSFSVISTRTSTVAKQPNDATEIGVGARAGLVVGHSSPALRKLLTKIHALQLQYLAASAALEPLIPTSTTPPTGDPQFTAVVNAVSAAFKAAANSNDSAEQKAAYAAAEKSLNSRLVQLFNDANRTGATQALQAGSTALLAQLEASLSAAVQTAQILDDDRRGFSLSMAAASAWLVPDTGVDDGRLTRWGVWATPSYRPDVAPIEIIGVRRFIRRADTDRNMLDAGARLTTQTGPLNWSFEYVARVEHSSSESNVTSERLATILDVRVRDDIYVTASFGKDFADPSAGRPSGGILSTLGLSFGFGEKPTIALK